MDFTYFIIFGLIAYHLGSIPTAVWVGKAWYNIDVREHGSNNAGATNTFRVLGKKPGIIVLAVDIVKGFIAVSLVKWLNYFMALDHTFDEVVQVQVVCAVAAILGHIFPVFAGFKGGKGVATSLGVIVGLEPLSALICIGLFLIVFIISNYVSLGAIIVSFAFPVVVWWVTDNSSDVLFIFSIILSLAVIAAHRKNIKRLIKGEENKMNLFKK
ncbi:MAG: glycerol-3-phosphate 1-O-acyltransferase PlsY [Crocinitomicaceae bacterium]